MNTIPPAALVSVRTSKICGDDRTYAITPDWFPVEPLRASILRAGIISPLHLQTAGTGTFRIVAGFRRYAVAAALGIGTVPALIDVAGDGLPSFLLELFDNLGSRPLHDLEKAAVLAKLQGQFDVSHEELIDEFLPALGIPPNRFQLGRFLELARLSVRLQRSVYSGLEAEIATRLAKWKSDDQESYLGLLSTYQPGRNRRKELFTLLDELRTDSGSVTQVLEASGASAVDRDSETSPVDRFQRILEILRARRYPTLTAHEQRYQDLKHALRIPPEIQFNAPRYFEGDQISIAFSFRSVEQLREIARKLNRVAEKPELGRILEML